MLHYFFYLMNFKVNLLQTLILFFISMLIVLKHIQLHLGFNACIFRRYPFTNSDDIRSLGW